MYLYKCTVLGVSKPIKNMDEKSIRNWLAEHHPQYELLKILGSYYDVDTDIKTRKLVIFTSTAGRKTVPALFEDITFEEVTQYASD